MNKRILEELKPCPCCGSTKVGIINFGNKSFKVVCGSDPNCPNSFLRLSGRFYSTDVEAVKEWNRRV